MVGKHELPHLLVGDFSPFSYFLWSIRALTSSPVEVVVVRMYLRTVS